MSTLEDRLMSAVDAWFDRYRENDICPGIPGAKDSYMMAELKDAIRVQVQLKFEALSRHVWTL